jgi:hypothetical protein
MLRSAACASRRGGPGAARSDAGARPRQDHTRVVSREAGIADDGVVLTGELDHNVESHVAAATDAAAASRTAPAEELFDHGPGCVRLSGLVSSADVGMVAS